MPPSPFPCSAFLACCLFGCGPPPIVTAQPWPDNDWIGVVEYQGRETNPDKVTNEDALQRAGRACNGPFRILAAKHAMVGRYSFVNGIQASEPREGTAVAFQCLDPELARKRCERYGGKSTQLSRKTCVERMDAAD